MGKLNAGMKIGDIVLQATGRQLNRLGSKLGMDKDILKGMSENQVKGAVLDESQKYMRNKRRNTNRRVGAAAVTGAATYGVADFLHDMLGISSVADGTLSASERPKAAKKKPTGMSDKKKKPVAKKTPKKKMPIPKTLPKSKPKPKPKKKSMFDTTGTTKGNTIKEKKKGNK